MLTYYKAIVILVCEVLLTRTLISNTEEQIRDYSMIFIILLGFVTNDFAVFNFCILIIALALGFYTFMETALRKRLEEKERKHLEEEISNLTLLCGQLQFIVDNVEEYQQSLIDFRNSKFADLIAATHMLYEIPNMQNTEEQYKRYEALIQDCMNIYRDATLYKYSVVDIFDDLSDKRIMRHLIRELKRIKRDNDVGDKFNNFLDANIKKLEVMISVNSRINDKDIKLKQRVKGNHFKRESRKRKHTVQRHNSERYIKE